ncbi:MAG: hypothetical protein M1825_004715 [Sarcosagium campestre]|nr:MAG: hypothetical protein M1825_004715 [Sarcosagium campestre]
MGDDNTAESRQGSQDENVLQSTEDANVAEAFEAPSASKVSLNRNDSDGGSQLVKTSQSSQASGSYHRTAQRHPFSNNLQNPTTHESPRPNREGSNALNMAALSSAVPSYHFSNQLPPHQQQRYNSSASNTAPIYQALPYSPFAGQQGFPYDGNQAWLSMQYAQAYPGQQHVDHNSTLPSTSHNLYHEVFHGQQNPSVLIGNSPTGFENLYHSQQISRRHQPVSPMYYPPGDYGSLSRPLQPQLHSLYNPPFPQSPNVAIENSSFRRAGSEGEVLSASGRRSSSVHGTRVSSSFTRPEGIVEGRSSSNTSSHSLQLAIPRGPPRKPRQSGHALWVGNLPPGTSIVELKDHFSQEATDEIESVFLISKSNCAFVNYGSEMACSAAMSRFQDSRFRGVRLVCRLRRNPSTPSPIISTEATKPLEKDAIDASTSSTTESGRDHIKSRSGAENSAKKAAAAVTVKTNNEKEGAELPDSAASIQRAIEPTKDKYFVVKSLTVEDLELSVRNGHWATQSHNEASLNRAWESSKNVYLIFSANKSGEYFGYARMESAIEDVSISGIIWIPKTHPEEIQHLPKAIRTLPTESAPAGRIIDDSARGTIFWEAIGSDDDAGEVTVSETEQESGNATPDREFNINHAPGRPFKVRWISTTRLPFYRTRGLRNSWNANREVKIARDGTELETSVGSRLLQLFHRPFPDPTHAEPSGQSYGTYYPQVQMRSPF